MTTDVEARLAQDSQLKDINVGIETWRGHVTVYGVAPTAYSRSRIAQLAADTRGVIEVDNRLVVERKP